MELTLKRIAKKKAYTIGRLSITTKSLTPSPSPAGEGSGYTHGMNQVQSDYSHGMYEVQGNSQENYLLPSPVGEGQGVRLQENSQENYLLPSPSGEGQGVRLLGNSQENYLLPSPVGEGQGVRLPGNSQENYLLPSPPGEGQGVRLEGASYFCDTLEPTWRDYAGGARKVKGCSAIPEGRYAVVITWSPKFKEWLPLLLGDAEFRRCWSGIRIHAGNTPADTAGCILVGENKAVGKVYNSRIWLHRLKKLIVEAKDRGEPVWMTVR